MYKKKTIFGAQILLVAVGLGQPLHLTYEGIRPIGEWPEWGMRWAW